MFRSLVALAAAAFCVPLFGCRTDDFITDDYGTTGTPDAGSVSGGRGEGGSGGGGRGNDPDTQSGGGPAPAPPPPAPDPGAMPGSGAGVDMGMGQPAPPDAGAHADVAPAGPDATPSASAFKVAGVATWRGNAAAAFSVVHEVVCDPSVSSTMAAADPELTRRGLRGGFGLIVGRCESRNQWNAVKTLVEHGHDVFSQTLEHPCLSTNMQVASACDPMAPRTNDYGKQIDQAATLLKQRAGVDPGFFLFPYDACDSRAVDHLKKQGYLGARCGGQGTNPSNFGDSFKIAFDLWGPAFSSYYNDPACTDLRRFQSSPASLPAACRRKVLERYLADTISRKAWGLQGFHGFDADRGFQPISPAEYRQYLDALAARVKAGELWVEGPSTVIRYRQARQQCPAPTVVSGSSLRFAAPSDACQRVATTLSYLVETTDGSDPATLSAAQAGTQRPVTKLGKGRFVVDADPTKGDVFLAN